MVNIKTKWSFDFSIGGGDFDDLDEDHDLDDLDQADVRILSFVSEY